MTLTYLPVIPAGTLNGAARPNPIQAAAAYATLRVIYGTPRVVAQVANVINSGTSWVIQVIWGEGQIQGISNVLFNDENPPASMTATHYLGTASQTVNATLVAAFAAKGVTFTDNLNGIAYSVFTVVASSVSGMPAISALVAGRLVYDPRVNLLTNSEQFDAWANNGLALVANAMVAPNGTMTAETSNTVVGTRFNVVSVTAGATYTYSLHVKPLDPTKSIFLFLDGVGSATLVPSTGAAGTISGTAIGSSIVAVGNGWYRASVTIVATMSGNQPMHIYPLNADLHGWWGAQFESGAVASPYTPTTTAVTPVTAHSDNPALCLADFASNNVYGMGMTVDTNSIITAALLCDALVSSAKRRRLSLALDQAQDANVWLEVLAAYAGCWATVEGANVVLIPDRPAAVSKVFDHASGNILEISNLKRRGVAGLPTAVEVRYTDTSVTPWREASQWAYLPGVVAGTYPRRESQVMMLGIQTASQALREATERLNKLTLGDLSCTLKVFDDGLALVSGDVVSATHPIGLTAKEFRVLEIASDLGRHTLSLLEYDPAVYSDLTVTVPTTPDTLLPNAYTAVVAAATALTVVEEVYFAGDGTMATRLRATWTPAADLWEIRHRITFTRMTSAGGGSPLLVTTAYSETGNYAQAPLEDGYWYSVAVTVERLRTAMASPATAYAVQALGKALPPSNVVSLAIAAKETGAVLTWPAVIDLDMKGYRIKAVNWAGTLVLDTPATTANIGYPPIGSNVYVIKALDWSGNESSAVATATLVVPAVPAVTNFVAAVSGKDLLLTWTHAALMWPLSKYEIRYGGTAWGVGDTYLTEISGTSFRAPTFAAGSRDYRIRATDAAGNNGAVQTVTAVIIGPGAVTALRAEVVDNNALIYWGPPATGNLPVDRYEARKGASWAAGAVIGSNGNSTFTTVFEQLAGLYTYWVVAVDSFGNESAPWSVVAAISQPPDYLLRANIDSDFNGRNFEFSAAGNAEGWSLVGGTTTVSGGVLTLTSTGIDPTLILSTAGEFFSGSERPRALVRIRRIAGASWQGTLYYETAGHTYAEAFCKYVTVGPAIGETMVLEFDMAALTAGGTDWMDNRITALRFDFGSSTADIFEIDYIRFVSYTGTNILLEEANTLLLPVNTTETWAQHFVNNAWASPQAQITAGFPLYAEPNMASSVYTQQLDYGSTLPATNITTTLNTTAVAGSVPATCQISYRLTAGATAWTDAAPGTAALASNFRYVKVVYTFTAVVGTNLLRVNALNTKLSIKQRSDAGSGTAAIGGTVVPFNYAFISADLPVVQPGGSLPRIPVVIYVGGANPTSFTVKIYDLAGSDVGGTFSWNAKGY